MDGADVVDWKASPASAINTVHGHQKSQETIADFDPDTAELPSWVEVIVSEASTVDNVSARVTEAVEGRPFEVVTSGEY